MESHVPETMKRKAVGVLVVLAFVAAAARGAGEETESAASRLARAEAGLREIVEEGRREDPLPIPSVTTTEEIHAEDWERFRALLEASPTAWSPEERRWLAKALDRYRGHRVVDWTPSRETRPDHDSLLPLLRAARLVALEGGLARSNGDGPLFLDATERQMELSARLHEAEENIGAILATGIYRTLLLQVQDAVTEADFREPVLAPLEVPLLRWLELPDAGVLVARDALRLLETVRDPESAGTLSEPEAEPGFARLVAPVAEMYLEVARACHEGPEECHQTGELVEREMKEPGSGAEAIALFMGPNVLYFARQRSALDELTELARAALTLRLLAEETGGYPPSLDLLPAHLAAARGELDLDYSLDEGGGARLALAGPSIYEDMPQMGERLRGLSEWTLPPIERD